MRQNLEGASLKDAHLEHTFLYDARLEGASLRRAHLNGATLHLASLYGAHLEGAQLQDAVGLRQNQLDLAFGDENTELPNGLSRPDNKRWKRASSTPVSVVWKPPCIV